MIPNRSGKGGGTDDRDRSIALHRLQSEFLESELNTRKKRQKYVALVAEIRKLRADISRLSVSLREKESEETKLSRELAQLEAEGGRIKKRINQFS